MFTSASFILIYISGKFPVIFFLSFSYFHKSLWICIDFVLHIKNSDVNEMRLMCRKYLAGTLIISKEVMET